LHEDDFEPEAGDPLDEPGQGGLVAQVGGQGSAARAGGDFALVLASRADPPLRLHRLRVAGELCEPA
jgi:hypothetical protein